MQISGEELKNFTSAQTPGEQNLRIQNLMRVFQLYPSGVVFFNANGTPYMANHQAEVILGGPIINIKLEDWPKRFGLFDIDDNSHYAWKNLPVTRALNGENAIVEEVIQKKDDSSEISWLRMSALKIETNDGNITGAILFLDDISNNKKIEALHQRKIKQAEAAFTFQQEITQISNNPRKILNTVVAFAAQNIGDGCVAALLNLPGNKLRVIDFKHINPLAQNLLYTPIISKEYDVGSLIETVITTGKPLLIPTLDQDELIKRAQPTMRDYVRKIGVQSIVVVPIKGRNRILGTLSLLRDRGGTPYTIDDQVFLMDIAYRTGSTIDNNFILTLLQAESSGRRSAEAALELSEARFQTIFNATSLGIKLVDKNLKLIETNPAFQKMLGYNDDELNGNPLSTIIYPNDVNSVMQLIRELENDGSNSVQLEHRLVHKNGSPIWVNGTFTGIQNSNQEKSQNFIFVIDENINDRKHTEAEMAQMKRRLQSHLELERLRLAQELHDGPLQDLYTALYDIENISNQSSLVSSDKIEALKTDLHHVIKGIRDAAKDLRPPSLASFGLEKAISSHAAEFIEKHPELSIQLDLAQDGQILPEDIRIVLFRIYQHLLTNILRHAQACRVFVRFRFDTEKTQLEMRDDGIGFKVPNNWVELVRQGHYGLAGAVERVTLLNGSFKVTSSPGEGTRVVVDIPIPAIVETMDIVAEDD